MLGAELPTSKDLRAEGGRKQKQVVERRKRQRKRNYKRLKLNKT